MRSAIWAMQSGAAARRMPICQAPIWAPEMDYPAICAALEETGYCEEMMLLYLGLDVEAPMPIVEGIGKARSFLEACF